MSISVSSTPLYSDNTNVINATVQVTSDTPVNDPLTLFSSNSVKPVVENQLGIRPGTFSLTYLTLSSATNTGNSVYIYSYYVKYTKVGYFSTLVNMVGPQGPAGAAEGPSANFK